MRSLRDPSHARALTVGEWLELMRGSGFRDVTHELLDQHIAFAPWTSRMRCDAETISRLEVMLGEEPLRTFLKPRVTEDGPTFTLQEAIVVGRKPERT